MWGGSQTTRGLASVLIAITTVLVLGILEQSGQKPKGRKNQHYHYGYAYVFHWQTISALSWPDHRHQIRILARILRPKHVVNPLAGEKVPDYPDYPGNRPSEKWEGDCPD